MQLIIILVVIYIIVRNNGIKKNGSSPLPGMKEITAFLRSGEPQASRGGGGAAFSEDLSSRSRAASGRLSTRNGARTFKSSLAAAAAGSTGKRKKAPTLRDCDGMQIEDRSHDWLAQQLREEERSYRAVSEMFEMKLSHMHSCDAEDLRLSHSSACDAEQLKEDSRS